MLNDGNCVRSNSNLLSSKYGPRCNPSLSHSKLHFYDKDSIFGLCSGDRKQDSCHCNERSFFSKDLFEFSEERSSFVYSNFNFQKSFNSSRLEQGSYQHRVATECNNEKITAARHKTSMSTDRANGTVSCRNHFRAPLDACHINEQYNDAILHEDFTIKGDTAGAPKDKAKSLDNRPYYTNSLGCSHQRSCRNSGRNIYQNCKLWTNHPRAISEEQVESLLNRVFSHDLREQPIQQQSHRESKHKLQKSRDIPAERRFNSHMSKYSQRLITREVPCPIRLDKIKSSAQQSTSPHKLEAKIHPKKKKSTLLHKIETRNKFPKYDSTRMKTEQQRPSSNKSHILVEDHLCEVKKTDLRFSIIPTGAAKSVRLHSTADSVIGLYTPKCLFTDCNISDSTLLYLVNNEGLITILSKKSSLKVLADSLELLIGASAIYTHGGYRTITLLLTLSPMFQSTPLQLIDTQLGAWIMNPNKPWDNLKEIFQQQRQKWPIDADKLLKSSNFKDTKAWAAFFTEHSQILTGMMSELRCLRQEELYLRLETPCQWILATMHLRGIHLDLSMLKTQAVQIKHCLRTLEENASHCASRKINLNSPTDIRKILYDELKLHHGIERFPKTIRGHLSTSESALQRIKEKHPLPRIILQHRTASRLLSTYINGILPHAPTGILHPEWLQARINSFIVS